MKIENSHPQAEKVSNKNDLANWQKQIIDDRLLDYYNNPECEEDFDQLLDEIERTI
ncbi:MAG: hypothetical protein WCP85_17150 [Mariniphaga sp.]